MKKLTEEHKKHLSEAMKGNKNSLGYCHLEEARKKESETRKGANNPMFGKHHSEEAKQKMSENHKGHSISKETRRKISEANKGNKSMLGKHHSEECKRKISEAEKGHSVSKETRFKISKTLKGIHPSLETRLKLSELRKGSGNPNWQGGINPENERTRKGIEICLWKKAVFERDNFTCAKCGRNGGDLMVHHINNFADFPELRTSLENGTVLCNDCHNEFHKQFGKRNNTKEQLEKFLGER